MLKYIQLVKLISKIYLKPSCFLFSGSYIKIGQTIWCVETMRLTFLSNSLSMIYIKQYIPFCFSQLVTYVASRENLERSVKMLPEWENNLSLETWCILLLAKFIASIPMSIQGYSL